MPAMPETLLLLAVAAFRIPEHQVLPILPAQKFTCIPPHALSELHDVLNAFQNRDPGTALFIAGDFNKPQTSHAKLLATH